MSPYSLLVSFALIVTIHGSKKNAYPPHCTVVSKDTDYTSKYKFDYPMVYIIPGQREAYQQMFCINPATVKKAYTTVCDWVAPPQVQFTLGDEYMHVVRQDPSGRYLGNAVIATYQLCGHNMSHVDGLGKNEIGLLPIITELE